MNFRRFPRMLMLNSCRMWDVSEMNLMDGRASMFLSVRMRISYYIRRQRKLSLFTVDGVAAIHSDDIVRCKSIS